MEYTPGKWMINDIQRDNNRINISSKYQNVACAYRMVTSEEKEDPETQANASLIAAAPDLLEHGYTLAVLSLQSDRYSDDPDFRDAVDGLLDVCRRAKGE